MSKSIRNGMVLLVILLLVLSPLVNALQITNVRAEEITQTTAVVKWETDEAADTIVKYGTAKEELQTVGDARSVQNHSFLLRELANETMYYYAAISGSVEENSSGNFYSFTTLAPDRTAPALEVEIPVLVAGTVMALTGKTERGATLSVKVNGEVRATATATDEEFTIDNIRLDEDKANEVVVQASDAAGNTVEKTGNVIADTHKPRVELEKVSELAKEASITLKGTISENASYTIFVNNRSMGDGKGMSIEQRISLEEGTNVIRVVARDDAGWETIQEFTIEADTQPPFVRATIAKGSEYFETSAESDISGESEPGAVAYLYIVRPQNYEFKPDFKRARERVVADSAGKFTFEDVDFATTISDVTLDDLAPREVPSGLQEISIFPIQQVAQQEQFTYFVYIIVEDKGGKSAFWQSQVHVNSCFSKDFDFAIGPGSFQFPLRLNPALLDTGRQQIQTVFELKYNGRGQPKIAPGGEIIEQGYRIVGPIRFEKACTPAAQDEKFTGLACKLLAQGGQRTVENNDKSAVYVTWNLLSSAELSKRDDDFWNDLKKRELIFPVKVRVQYQERIGPEQWSETKVQTSCSNLAYAVDIPLEAGELIPDFLSDNGIKFLNSTIHGLQTARPVVETAFYGTAVTCISASGMRWIVRSVRLFQAKWEWFQTVLKPTGKKDLEKEELGKCPLDQGNLYLRKEIEAFLKLPEKDRPPEFLKRNIAGVDDEQAKLITLEERCPKTAAAWKAEAALHQAYRWSCDRSACRAVPARWTEDKPLEDIEKAIAEEAGCAVTGKGIPLEKVEGCEKFVEQNLFRAPEKFQKEGNQPNVCWRMVDGTLYVRDEDKDKANLAMANKGVYHLTAVGHAFKDIGPLKDDLLVYQYVGAEGYIVGRDQTCEQVCADRRKPGYKGNGCVKEELDESGKIISKIDGGVLSDGRRKEYLAGYTSDCFIDNTSSAEPIFQQCVCQVTDKDKKSLHEARTALEPEAGSTGQTEEWFYHQEEVFKESKGKQGTLYPKIRYYEDRDRSGAFGADHVLDYLPGPKTIPEVNPYTQYLAPWQQVCLSGMLKQMKLWENVMIGARNCLIEAKHTPLQDAGMCKTLLAQHVCGLVYKGIAYMTSGCQPSIWDDYKKEGAFEDLSFIITEGGDAFADALDSSIRDLQEDYGNAVFTDYFKGGAQGFAQSLCMAAFGFDFPLFSKDFLLDSAYAFPMKSVPLVFPATRELTSYNPAAQTTVHSYEIGGTVLTGCRIRRMNVKLKCIGPEDRGFKGVDLSCGGEGCDCLGAQSGDGAFEGEKERLIPTKKQFNLGSGEAIDLGIESPLTIDSHYRFDHVIVELELDPSERNNVDKCVDKEYAAGEKAIYYFPIKDVSPKGQFSCKVDAVSGRYICPELSEKFGFGGTYMEQPYVTCWNKETKTWMDCTTDNLFVQGDEIKTRVHLNSDGKPKCLKRIVNGVPGIDPIYWYEIPEGLHGPLFREDTLEVVQASMFGGSSGSVRLAAESSRGCPTSPQASVSSTGLALGPYRFIFEPTTAGKGKLRVPSEATVDGVGFRVDPSTFYLATDAAAEFTPAEINILNFDMQGVSLRNVLGTIDVSDGSQKVCTYQLNPATSGALTTTGLSYLDIFATYELYEPANSGCKFATIRVKPSLGKAQHSQPIRIQQTRTETEQLEQVHQRFMQGNYQFVRTWAMGVIEKLEGDMTNALAVYYLTASEIMEAGGDPVKYRTSVSNMLTLFFDREWGSHIAKDYSSPSTAEHQKITKYMCEIDGTLDKKYQADARCNPSAVLPATGAPGATAPGGP